jgi:hypothetical protein
MKNVEISVDGNILNIKVDLSKEYSPSSSGKTIIVASTEGNVSIPDREEKLGLNVYRKSEWERPLLHAPVSAALYCGACASLLFSVIACLPSLYCLPV